MKLYKTVILFFPENYINLFKEMETLSNKNNQHHPLLFTFTKLKDRGI